MHDRHLPSLGPRFWVALCLASIFGANLGDSFAHILGLGHVKGLPFLGAALLFIVVAERFDQSAHEAWYWSAIVVVRTAATNIGDLLCGDLHIPRPIVMGGLALALAAVVTVMWLVWRRNDPSRRNAKQLILRADVPYWICMLLAGALGTVMGDYFSHNLYLGDARASVVLSAGLFCFFVLGAGGRLWRPAFYWATVVMVRAAGTAVGDLFAQRAVLGLGLSTVVTGLAFATLVLVTHDRDIAATPPGNS
jgi:uncharacterized membrane-anchored protein